LVRIDAIWTYPEFVDTGVKQYCRGVGKDMGDARKKYTKEFKLDAIRLLESGTKPGHEIERDLGSAAARSTAGEAIQ